MKNRSLKAIDFAPGQFPAGPAGAKGDRGDRGEPGPTEGVSAVSTSSAVPANLTNQFGGSTGLSAKITTKRAGKLLLLKDFWAGVECPQGLSMWWWLTLDGAAVPGSLRSGPAEDATSLLVSLNGVTAESVPAGEHTVSVGGMCLTGTPSAFSWHTPSGGSAVVLG